MEEKKTMKIVGLSDIHGDLITNVPECDVVCICGDIMPLYIQRYTIASAVWIGRDFLPWVDSLPCEKVILVAGNHDFIFDDFNKKHGNMYSDEMITEYVSRDLLFPDKLVYLQDTEYEYDGVVFYGSPWCPELSAWAFYKKQNALIEAFGKIPKNVDVLLTHSPGKNANGTGQSLELRGQPEYGSQELTDAVLKRNIKLWMCGHVHTGSHKISKLSNGTDVVNVSIKNEEYDIAFEPTVYEIEKGRH